MQQRQIAGKVSACAVQDHVLPYRYQKQTFRNKVGGKRKWKKKLSYNSSPNVQPITVHILFAGSHILKMKRKKTVTEK